MDITKIDLLKEGVSAVVSNGIIPRGTVKYWVEGRDRDIPVREDIEDLVRKLGVKLEYGNPSFDRSTGVISMHPLKEYDSADLYYSSLLHELSHWAGYKLDDGVAKKIVWWGDIDYAREEVVAEIAAWLLEVELGVYNPYSIEYIGAWLLFGRIELRDSMVEKAIERAQFILDIQVEGRYLSPTGRINLKEEGI